MARREHSEPYAQEVDPAIPVIRRLRLWAEGTGWSVEVQAILDSGADKSVLPGHIVTKVLDFVETTSFEVEGAVPSATDATAVKLKFGIADFDEHETWFVLLGEEAIVGRDILNRYRTVLDGPPLDGDHATVTLERRHRA